MSFLLTVEDIKNVSFRRANFGGYKPEDVDAFIDDVELSYQKILERNQTLCGEVEDLKRRIEKLQSEDGTIKKLILNAKEIADGTLSKAKEKTAELVLKATAESEKIMKRAKQEVDFQKEIFNKLKAESANLRKKLDDVYKEHLKLFDNIPETVASNSNDSESDGNHMEFDGGEDVTSNLECLNVSSQDVDYDNIESGANTNISDLGIDATDINLSSEHEKPHRRNLKFGKDYNISEDEADTGAYSGLFKS